MAFDALDEAMAQVLDLELDALGTAERFTVLGWCEKVRCRLPAAEHGIINALARQATPAEIGGRLSHVLADRLHITRTEAGRRIHDAEDLGSRHALNGERLPPATDGNGRRPARRRGEHRSRPGHPQLRSSLARLGRRRHP